MSETEALKVIRRREAVVTGTRREGEEECVVDWMGWPPQPVCWHICGWRVSWGCGLEMGVRWEVEAM